MDLTASIVPRSDQLNADDLIGGPLTVTIADVKQGTTEQPVNVELIEYPGRAYRPSKSMRRVVVACWGPETSTYKGRQLTLYRNPDIKFGGEKVGGIEISHASHIDAPVEVSLTVTRGKRKPFKVEPLTVRDWYRDLKLAGTNIEAVILLGKAAKLSQATPDVIKDITNRYNELKATV